MSRLSPAVVPSAPPRLAALIAGFAAIYLIWGSTYLAIRVAVETIPPFTMMAVRCVVGSGLLLAWAAIRGWQPPRRSEWLWGLTLGAVMFVGGQGFVAWAEQEVASGVAALIVTTAPVWILVLEWFRGRVTPTPGLLLGIGLSLGGVLVLVDPLAAGAGAVAPFQAGVLVFGSVMWAVGTVAATAVPLPVSKVTTTGVMLAGGGIALTVVGAVAGEWSGFDGPVSVRSAAGLVYLIVFGTIIAFGAYIWLLGVASPTRVASHSFVNPVVAVILGAWLMDEPFGWRVVLATGIIAVGVVLVLRRPRSGTARRRGASRRPTGPEPAHLGAVPAGGHVAPPARSVAAPVDE